jgi:lysophospholipase L1-like esterase
MRRLYASMMAAVCAVAVFALISGPAFAKKPGSSTRPATNAPVVPGSQYLALGDSVTFGYEEPTVVPPPNYADAASFIAYPQILGEEYHLSVAN